MFAYCRNNPISRKDASGTHDMCIINFNEDSNPFNDLVSPSGGGGGGKGSGFATRKNKGFIEKTVDFLTNSNEEVVLEAEHFAFYKGALVVYHSSEYLTSWAWGGVIFLNRDSRNKTTLAHEYGHILREREYGTVKYTFSVFLPSSIYNIASRYNSTLYNNYYNMPWEYDAEVNGEVNRAYNYAEWAPDIRECYFLIWDGV